MYEGPLFLIFAFLSIYSLTTIRYLELLLQCL